jgi:hypothetical protein
MWQYHARREYPRIQASNIPNDVKSNHLGPKKVSGRHQKESAQNQGHSAKKPNADCLVKQ